MKTINEHIRDHLFSQSLVEEHGDSLRPVKQEQARAPFPAAAVLKLWKTEWVPEFECYMRNRFVMGALRYGTMAENKARRTPYDRVSSMIKRLQSYRASGNLEHLVDVANLAMLEFDQTIHPQAHFEALDGDRRIGTERHPS
jgi:hypothetical protein